MLPLTPAFPPTAATRARREVPVRSDFFNSIAAYWPMEGEEGKDEADLVGRSRLGSYNTVGSAEGLIGNCRTFDRRLFQYLGCATNAALLMGASVTKCYLSIWLNPSAVNAVQYVFGHLNGVAANTLIQRLQISATGLPQWNVSDGVNSPPTRNGTAILANVWSHLGLFWTGTVLRVDVNNVAGATTPQTTGIWAGPASLPNFYIGAGTGGTTQIFDGLIDDFFISKNYAPSAADTAWNYNDGAGRSFTEFQNYAPYQILLWYLLDKARRAIGLRPPGWAVVQLPRIPKKFRGRGAQVGRPAYLGGMA